MAEHRLVQSLLRNLAAKVEHRGEVVVVGLGRFGASLATTLTEMGVEVLGVDADPAVVQSMSEVLAHVVHADTTDERALRQLGLGETSTAVVCIGEDIEASVLTTAAIADLGVPNLWAKARTAAHASILERVGAHNVVQPEAEMGARLAHIVIGGMLDYVALDDDFALAEMVAPAVAVGIALGDSGLRAKWRVTIVCHKTPGGTFTYADRDTVLSPSDLIVVAGHRGDVDRFAAAR